MRKISIALLAATTLAACGGQNAREALLSDCTDSGQSTESCTCVIDVMQDHLSPSLFRRMAQAAQESEGEFNPSSVDLSDEDREEFMSMAPHMLGCIG